MYEKILVPLDGSELAERALAPALALAADAGGQVIFLRVPEKEQRLVEPNSAVDTYHLEMTDEQTRQKARTYLDELVTKYQRDDIELTSVVRTVESNGEVSRAILDVAEEEDVDLIVISSHGYGGVRQAVLGSTTADVLKKCPRPVLAIRSERELNNVMITLDGSQLSESALEPGLRLAHAMDAAVTLLRVQDDLDYVDEKSLDAMEHSEPGMGNLVRRSVYSKVDNYLERLARRYGRDEELDIEVATLVGEPAKSIAQIAEQRDVDVIVMATHGHTGFLRLVYGSVMQKVLHGTDRSMLVIRPGDD